ncbi:nucleotidyl transferase AbiEii/AbiGii toxin family protein [Candidatus Uhrbacteria bacterium]|nr:nucleotidyl transferase AbiEii/AbiGii toxin family protein [Candidatus Uhrbacteria bacterium]
MEPTILTTAQRRVLDAVMADDRFASYYLTGGTALAAFHLHHRVSDDLDCFTAEEQDPIAIHAFVDEAKAMVGATEVRYVRLHDHHIFTFALDHEDLKVEFTRYPFPRLEPVVVYNRVRADGLRDIAANKFAALLDRFDPKDFVDLYFLLQKRSLSDLRRDTEQKFGMKIDDVFLGGELAKVRRIAALPRMLVPLTVEDLKAFFTDRARELGPSVLRE